MIISLPESIAPVLHMLAQSANEESLSLYVVGGFVRDLLLKLPLRKPDLDLVVAGDAVSLAHAIAKQYGGTITAHPSFGTATWHPPADSALPSLDFATTRIEHYAAPAALPTVILLQSKDALIRDARRRDFSINTLAVQLAPEPFGKLIDPLKIGIADLRRCALRTLHPLSFEDDPTRMLRAARFVARLGAQLVPEDVAQLQRALPHLAKLSGERLRHEFDLILSDVAPAEALRWLAVHGILQAIHPRLNFDERLVTIYATLADLNAPDDLDPLVLRWAIFGCTMPDDPALLARLALDKTTRRALSEVHRARIALAALPPEALPSQIVRALEPFCPEAILAAALFGTALDRERAQGYLEKWRYVQLAADGNFLRELGLKPSPLFGKLLSRLRDAVLNGEAETPEAQRALLRQWLDESQKQLS